MSLRNYIIQTEAGDLHSLSLKKSDDLLWISTNKRSIALTPTMAEQILLALRALLSGQFDRALTETALLLEIEEATSREGRIAAARPFNPPELDSL